LAPAIFSVSPIEKCRHLDTSEEIEAESMEGLNDHIGNGFHEITD
jgi:hypothetical protein